LRAEVDQLDVERGLAEENFEAARQPEGFGLALQVLTVLTVLGIGVPVIVMGNGATKLSPWARAAVIAVFMFGLAVLLRFLFVYASFLHQEGRRHVLPRSVFGLMWTKGSRG
jgi:hypothetical protein